MEVKKKLTDDQVRQAHVIANEATRESNALVKEKPELETLLKAKKKDIDEALSTAHEYSI